MRGKDGPPSFVVEFDGLDLLASEFLGALDVGFTLCQEGDV